MHLEEDVVQGSLQKTEPFLSDVQLFLCDWKVGRVGAWGYELAYRDHKKEEMGLFTDCEYDPYKPAITAAYQAVTSLKRKCRIGIETHGCVHVSKALEYTFDEPLNDEYGLLGDIEHVPGWRELVEAMNAHSIHFIETWKRPSWSPEHPLVKKVHQKAKNYIKTMDPLEQTRFSIWMR